MTVNNIKTTSSPSKTLSGTRIPQICFQELYRMVHTWFSVTNSASSPTRSPSFGSSSGPRGVKSRDTLPLLTRDTSWYKTLSSILWRTIVTRENINELKWITSNKLNHIYYLLAVSWRPFMSLLVKTTAHGNFQSNEKWTASFCRNIIPRHFMEARPQKVKVAMAGLHVKTPRVCCFQSKSLLPLSLRSLLRYQKFVLN